VSNLADQFASILLADRQVLPLIGDRLAYFATHPSEEWRTIWIIYLIEQLGQQQRFRAQLQRIENDRRFAQAVRLWCRRALLRKHGEPAHLPDDKIDDLDYVEAGLRCYGQNVCTGDGF
jgi:hypothetical protein